MPLEIAEAIDPFGVGVLLDKEFSLLASYLGSGLAKDRKEANGFRTPDPCFPSVPRSLRPFTNSRTTDSS